MRVVLILLTHGSMWIGDRNYIRERKIKLYFKKFQILINKFVVINFFHIVFYLQLMLYLSYFIFGSVSQNY